jgi:hypothetical protein
MANKLISQLTAGAANLQDVDQIEGQKSGELETKRFTGAQMRAVEKAERENQDNIIEASVGLSALGVYTPPANSWFMRAADFLAGCTDRAGATGSLTQNIYNALRLLDAKIAELSIMQGSIFKPGISVDTSWADLVPSYYMLEYVIIEEKSGQAPQLSCGTSPGGTEVFANMTLTTSGISTIVVQQVYSFSADTTIYLHDDGGGGDTWDGSTVDVYFVLRSLSPTGGGGISGAGIAGYYEFDCDCANPTAALLDANIGTASDFAPGSLFIIKDTDGGCTDYYFATTDGTSWSVNASVFVPA